ncbi:hypothetical protein DFQ29_000890 [Apophysomyces sp. BC1021]|nr:hypothetical protein DFQ29_000890 [Apophysomyces sp. BC1021]
MDVTRGEPPSMASAERKNRKRKLGSMVPMERKKIGRRCDSIIRRITVQHEPSDELGASEIAKQHDKPGTGVLKDQGQKLPKTLGGWSRTVRRPNFRIDVQFF